MNDLEGQCSILSAMLTEKQIHHMENTFPLVESFHQCSVFIFGYKRIQMTLDIKHNAFFVHLVLQFHLQLLFLRHPIQNIVQKKKEQGRYWRDTTWYTT